MQSWVVTDGGRQRIAVTTTDGFTVVGDVIGPGGQDLSSALLAISGLSNQAAPSAPGLQSSSVPPTTSQQTALSLPQGALSNVLPQPQANIQAAPVMPPQPASTAAAAHASTSAVPSSAGATPPPITMAKAQSVDDLFQQATDFSVWFSAGTPKPGAPAIYFVADPTCPHCAVAVDTLAQKVQAGDIDLRVILAPIRSQQAVYEAASMLQSQTPAADFMSHELSKTTSTTTSTLKVLPPAELNPEIVRGLQRNVEWIRANGVPGVPFWIFNTAEGGKVEFGEVKDTMLKSALPARGANQVASQGTQP